MSSPLKPLSTSLPSAVATLERRARAADELAAMVRAELPEELRAHVLGAAQRGDELALTVDSAAWAARLRYAGPDLSKRLTFQGRPAIAKIRIRVRGK